MNLRQFREEVLGFFRACSTGRTGEYTMYPGGRVTLYASCFSAMTLNFLDALRVLSTDERCEWAEYINQWQDTDTGLFVGPEIVQEELRSTVHDWDHVTMHLTAHALPALHVLNARPTHQLHFAHRFLEIEILRDWLNARDWRDAWLEGNNLLFVGQFLVYLRDFEKIACAQNALDIYFEWLNSEQDPNTGLWGTNGYCDEYDAMYGGYHQLLVYYYCDRSVPHADRIIDTTLRLQHADGSFTRKGGGGACEDVDAVDILVNLYKRTGRRQHAVKRSLQRALESVLSHRMPDGGFVYRRGSPFIHMGIDRSAAPANVSNCFATWFRVHTIALACQILQDHRLASINWRFNNSCSMGWHATTPLPQPKSNSVLDYVYPTWLYARSRLQKVWPSVRVLARGCFDRLCRLSPENWHRLIL